MDQEMEETATTGRIVHSRSGQDMFCPQFLFIVRRKGGFYFDLIFLDFFSKLKYKKSTKRRVL